jgi:predicted Zn-dependent protease
MDSQFSHRVVKRLAAAEGYLELGMPQAALAELDRITVPGPFEAIECLLRGEALAGTDHFDEAIEPLKKAAEMFPSPMNRRAWATLSKCYEATGQEVLAEAAASASHTESETTGEPGVVVQVVIQPIFTAVLGNQVRQLHR